MNITKALKEFMNTFDELHYFMGGLTTGIIVGFITAIFYLKFIIVFLVGG